MNKLNTAYRKRKIFAKCYQYPEIQTTYQHFNIILKNNDFLYRFHMFNGCGYAFYTTINLPLKSGAGHKLPPAINPGTEQYRLFLCYYLWLWYKMQIS